MPIRRDDHEYLGKSQIDMNWLSKTRIVKEVECMCTVVYVGSCRQLDFDISFMFAFNRQKAV